MFPDTFVAGAPHIHTGDIVRLPGEARLYETHMLREEQKRWPQMNADQYPVKPDRWFVLSA